VAVGELNLPPGRADWQGPLAAADEGWRPVFVGTHREWRDSYRDLSDHGVELIAIGYDSQAQRRELVNQCNSITGSGGLTSLRTAVVNADGAPYCEGVVADERGRRSLIWSFYVIGGRSLVMPLWAQLWYGLNALGAPAYSALFALRTACPQSCAEGRGASTDFVRAMRPGVLAAARTAHVPGSG
jgi:EpsI family protein